MPRAPVLSSQRLRLHPVGPREVRALLDGAPDPDLPWAAGFPSGALLAFLRKVVDDGALIGPFYAYIVVRRSDGHAIGDVGFHGPPGPDGEVEVGYGFVPSARGAGFATEAVRMLVEWALAQADVRAVVARVEEDNEFSDRSERLLRGLGFEEDGVGDGARSFVLR